LEHAVLYRDLEINIIGSTKASTILRVVSLADDKSGRSHKTGEMRGYGDIDISRGYNK